MDFLDFTTSAPPALCPAPAADQPRLAFLSAGAVDKLTLPEGMQNVDFSYCSGLTGTAELGMSDGQEGSLNVIIFI